MKSSLIAITLLASVAMAHADGIRTGASVQVKADALWFDSRDTLAHWQALKKAGGVAALASYQEGLLRNRNAWQFTGPIKVRIRGYRPKAQQVDVEMQTAGRLQGSVWMLDAAAIGP